jgi:putative inorganic carbon (hco3(-)) transporter
VAGEVPLAVSSAASEIRPVPLKPYRWTTWAAALTCALAPAYTIRWHYGFYPTTLLETAVLVAVLVFAIETFRQHSRLEWRTPFTWPAVLFIIAGAIAVLVAPDRRAGLGLYRAYLLEPIAFFFIVASVAREVRRALLMLGGLAVATLVVGLANAVVVVHAILTHRLDLAGTPPVVIYQTSNAVALFLLPVMAVAASLLVYGEDRRVRLASAAYLVLALPSFLLTFSRGGYLALLGVGLGLVLVHRRRWALLTIVVAVTIVFALIPPITTRIGHELNFSGGNNTLVGRTYLWSATLQMLEHYPLFGAGLSGFETRLGPYWNATHVDRFIYPHNLVLNFWTETGLLGLAAFGWILYTAFAVSWRGWRGGAWEWRAIQFGVFLALVGIVIHGLVDVPYFKNDLSLEFWALLAISWAGLRWGSGLRQPSARDTG